MQHPLADAANRDRFYASPMMRSMGTVAVSSMAGSALIRPASAVAPSQRQARHATTT